MELRRLRKWLRQELDDARRQAFQVVAALTAFLLLISLGGELLVKPEPDAATVATLVACLLAAAFLACFGKEVAGRIKKIGPIEIEILEVQKAVRGLDEIGAEVVKALDRPIEFSLNLEKTELSVDQGFYYREGDKLLSYLKFSGSEPESGAARDIFWELLFKVGRTAHTQLDWSVAIRWLEHLEALSDGSYCTAEVSNCLAFSILYSALPVDKEKDAPRRIRGLKKAAERFTALAAKGELDYLGYFWLAYAQDELEQWHEAVFSLGEALERRPRLAPSRYNLAIALLKLGKRGNAYWQLKNIRADDEQFEMVKMGVVTDQEMKSLVEKIEDSYDRSRLCGELDRLGR